MLFRSIMQLTPRNRKSFSIRQRLKSFVYAWRGLLLLIRQEHNAWIHLSAAAGVVIAGFCFNITQLEWIAVVFCIGLVLAAETFNTAIEKLANVVSPDWNELIGKVKDVAAGAVLICAITAAIVGLIIFIPYIFF